MLGVWPLLLERTFKSDDGEVSWSGSGFAGFWIGSIVVDPRNSNLVYGSGFLPRLAGGGTGVGLGRPLFLQERGWRAELGCAYSAVTAHHGVDS